uniref:Uncharacterized protein n=1 Tax=Anopheles funestus TaxID=62324 RepID=A0A182RLS0_ANOFN
MSTSLLHIVLGAVLVGLFASYVYGFKEQTYFDMTESESQEYGPTVVGEDNRLPCPYAVHGVRPPQGECSDCGFVIVEKRHHYCIPGKSVIKVLRRKPTCNCKTPNHHGSHLGSGYYASESKVVPNYEAPSTAVQGPSPVAVSGSGSEQVSRMLRTLINDSHRGSNYGDAADKTATPKYRTLDSSNAPRSFN